MKKAMREIFELIGAERGMDLSCYCPKFLERAVEKRMEAVDEEQPSRYLDLIKDDPSERLVLYQSIHNHNSAFFRDPFTFDFVEKKLLPIIMAEKIRAKENDVRIWSAACATGEEPYSIAIILNELQRDEDNIFDFSLFATDIDEEALKKACRGRYDILSMDNIRYSLLNSYFTITNGKYQIARNIREMVSFSQFDMTHPSRMAPEDSVFASFDIVLCRNLLIYIDKKGRNMIFNKIHKALAPRGYLVLGECEALEDEYEHLFESIDDDIHIYRKK